MSNLLQAPPPQIDIGGGGGPGGPPGMGGGPPDTSGGAGAHVAPPLPDDSTPPGGAQDSPVTSLLRQALINLQKAARMTPDDVEAAGITDLAAKLAKIVSSEQDMRDQVSGAGPAVKMIRKAGASGGGGGNGGGGGGGGGGGY